MAHALAERLNVQQTLHGYAEGHRLLAGSVNLSPKDMRMLLTMSDISGSGVRVDESGYLTGYPLTESGVYALARTWAAPEMPRPGCVWTHTLLVEFADLATLASTTELDLLFRRPVLPAYGDYTKPLGVDDVPAAQALLGDELAWCRRLLAALYGKPGERVIAARPVGVAVDTVVLAIWSQQWPRLRRGFRFCTLVAADRSSEGNVFDLQLLHPADRGVRTRFQKAVDADSVAGLDAPLFDEAMLDLANPDGYGLRSFLHATGGDIDRGRLVFGTLCRLHRYLREIPDSSSALRSSIDILTAELPPSQARSARVAIAKMGLLHANEFDDVVVDFILRHLELVDPDAVRSGATRLGVTIWKQDPRRLTSLLEREGASQIVAECTLAELSMSELLEGLDRFPSLSAALLRHKPDMASEPEFWAVDGIDIDAAFAALDSDGDAAHRALRAVIAAGRSSLVGRCANLWGRRMLLEACIGQFESGVGLRILSPWVVEAAQDSKAVAEILTSGNQLPWDILVMLARTVEADWVPNEIGEDPWIMAVRDATGRLSESDQTFFFAYLLCRALGNRSRNPGELARLGFELTYRAVEHNALPDHIWRALERRLPNSFFWFDWDRCPRLRAAVVNLFARRSLAPEAFIGLVESDELFMQLVEAASVSWEGREYLSRVSLANIDSVGHPFGYRIATVGRYRA